MGHGDRRNRIIFTEITGIPQNIYEVICGSHNTFIRLTNGKIMSCGINSSGKLGRGDVLDRCVFEEINLK